METISRSKLHADYVTYKKYQNRAVAAIRKAKKSFEKKLSENIKCDPKSVYTYVRSKNKTKIKVGTLIDSSNMQVEEEEQMCKIINQYCSSVFTLERLEGLMKLENRLNQEKVASNLNKVLITKEIVNKTLCSLKSNKAHWDDGMGSLMLKQLANELKGLSIIYNRSVSESKIPHVWIFANLTPILKKG